tara:strand:+ start:78 stop:251 length:174 start_codon:yes stop_codon:yes gene_type:complete
MKFIVSFKDGNAFHEALRDVPDEHKARAEELMHEWLSDYADIEFDIETGTATLIKPR